VWLLSCFTCFFALCLYMVARVFCVVAKFKCFFALCLYMVTRLFCVVAKLF